MNIEQPAIFLICGGRDYKNQVRVFQILDIAAARLRELHPGRRLLWVMGGAHGADEIARLWAVSRREAYVVIPAEWPRFDNAAGSRRNQQMLDWFKIEGVIAFPGGNGTQDMTNRSIKDEIPVLFAHGLEKQPCFNL